MSVTCRHWRDCGIPGGGCCAVGRYNKPSIGVCMIHCDTYDGPPRMSIREFLSGYGKLPPHAFTPESFRPGGAPIDPITVQVPASTARGISVQPRRLTGDVMGNLIGQVEPICPKCGGVKMSVSAPPRVQRSAVIAARPGDERRYLGDHVKGILEMVGIKDCPKWVPGSCDDRKANLNRAHRAVAMTAHRLAARVGLPRRITA